METTIETIEGKKMTVIWHREPREPLPWGHVWEELHEGFVLKQRIGENYKTIVHTATALPALPRHPKPDDARLLYRYISEGITPIVKHSINFFPASFCIDEKGKWDGVESCKIAHAINSETGKKVEVAIC